MATQPKRRIVEPGIVERVNSEGQRLGLEIVYKDAEGKTRRRAVKGGLIDARDALAKSRVKRSDHEAEPDNPRMTFAAVAARFRELHLSALRRNSRDFHEASLKRLEPVFGRKRLVGRGAIAKADVRKFIAKERSAGLKGWTIDGHLKTLRVIYSFAADDLDIPVTFPRLKPSERPNPADDEREHRILTDAELDLVLGAVGERERLFFHTLANTGARKSEGLGLTKRRVGADTAMLTIAEQLDEHGELVPIKNSKKRTIEITRSLADAAHRPARADLRAPHALTGRPRMAEGARPTAPRRRLQAGP
jgi:integrase